VSGHAGQEVAPFTPENENKRLALRERELQLAERRQTTREAKWRFKAQHLQADQETRRHDQQRAQKADDAQVNLKHCLFAVWAVVSAAVLGAAILNPIFAVPLASFHFAFRRFARLLLVEANAPPSAVIPTTRRLGWRSLWPTSRPEAKRSNGAISSGNDEA